MEVREPLGPLLGLPVEPRVLAGQRRLVGEGGEQPQVPVREVPAGGVVEHDGAQHLAAADHGRRGRHGAALLAEPGLEPVWKGRGGVAQEVGAPHRSPLRHGPPARPGARGQRLADPARGIGRPRRGGADEAAGLRIDVVEHGAPAAEQPQHGGDDPARHLGGIERLHQLALDVHEDASRFLRGFARRDVPAVDDDAGGVRLLEAADPEDGESPPRPVPVAEAGLERRGETRRGGAGLEHPAGPGHVIGVQEQGEALADQTLGGVAKRPGPLGARPADRPVGSQHCGAVRASSGGHRKRFWRPRGVWAHVQGFPVVGHIHSTEEGENTRESARNPCLPASGCQSVARASRSTSAGCLARRPARCSICWRQEMPGATTSVSAAAAWTAGASRRLPSVTDSS